MDPKMRYPQFSESPELDCGGSIAGSDLARDPGRDLKLSAPSFLVERILQIFREVESSGGFRE